MTTTYHYDAFGRRISKHVQTKHKSKQANQYSGKIIQFPVQKEKTQFKQVAYLWDGNRQLQEYTDTHVFTTLYEQGSFAPVARAVWLKDELLKSANDEILNAERESWQDAPKLIPNIQVYHYHNDHLGTPNELTTHEGEVVWLADYEAYGNTAKVIWREEKLESVQVAKEHLQPIRFQGQYYDEETGLHYNRFRYFDPDLGMFTTRDPIGLMGGSNVFQYAPNPTGWIDPFGLANCKLSAADKRKMGAPPTDMKKPHLHHVVREKAPKTWSDENRKLITEAQDVLKKQDIDVNKDPRNFVWAENGAGVHTIESAKKVHTAIMEGAKKGLEGVEKSLKEMGTMFNEMR